MSVTQKQINYMLLNYPAKTKQEIADKLKLPLSVVQWQLRKHGSTKWDHAEWSESEVEYIKANYPHVGSKPCAQHLGRSYKAVQKKAMELGIKRQYTYVYIDADGYYVTRKSRTESAKRVHRLIMESILGRQLTEDEVVHHKDFNKLNNDPSNLQVMTRAEHWELHKQYEQAQGLRDSLG